MPMRKKLPKPNRYATLANDLKDFKARKKKLKTTLIDKGGTITIVHANSPELAERANRTNLFIKIRSDLDLSQPAMAAALHVSPATVRNWEYGRRLIPEAMLILAELLRDVPAVRRRLMAA
jgi:DNA-binding transcriptional regulator YiaG